MDDPRTSGLYLGCSHEEYEWVLPDEGAKVRCIEYYMKDFLRNFVEKNESLIGIHKLKLVPTPFLEESVTPDFSDAMRQSGDKDEAPNSGAGSSNSAASELEHYAAKMLMTMLYSAPHARFDLLRQLVY